jgi:hypothetical protein
MDIFDTVAASERGAFVHLTNLITGTPAYLPGPDGKPDEEQPIGINIIGSDSPEFRTKSRKRAAHIVKRRAGKMDVSKMTESQILGLMDEGDDKTLHDLVDATVGWSNISLNGEPVDFTPERAEELYTRYPAIAAEVRAFGEDLSNFFVTA